MHSEKPGLRSRFRAPQVRGCGLPQNVDASALKVRLQEALNRLDPIDREVLSSRHLEQLTVTETAQELGTKEKAAGKRYLRALERPREVLERFPGGLEI